MRQRSQSPCILLSNALLTVFPLLGAQYNWVKSMKRITCCELFIVLLVSAWLLGTTLSGCRPPAKDSTYELVTKDGRVLSHTEVKPSVGDQYWDAASDTWYIVVNVQGTTAVMLPEAEAKPLLRAQELRRTGAGLAAAVVLLILISRLSRR